MSSEGFAIIVDNVSKCFEIYAHPSAQLKQLVLPHIQRVLGLDSAKHFREFWALRDVSIQVRRGQTYGIVGLNGSGKSTLLQIIAGTLSPTVGSVQIEGRVAALLELGSGLSPDLTGRENVFMNGAVLGFDRSIVDSKLESIESFADIGSHFDRPFSTYSSGMQMRLAFAIATAFDPQILIVDEALAVGDAYFQQKCFRRIEQLKTNGGTIIFVSHDANTVKHLCDTAILLNEGKVQSQGSPRDVIDLYQGLTHLMSDQSAQQLHVSQQNAVCISEQPTSNGVPVGIADVVSTNACWKKATSVTTNYEAELLDFKLLDENSRCVTQLESEKKLTVRYEVRLKKNFDRPAFGLIIRDSIGRSIFETSTYAMGFGDSPIGSGCKVVICFNMCFNLRAGTYSFSIGVSNRGYLRSEFEEITLLMHDVEQLQVVERQSAIYYGGVFNMNPIVTLSVT
jgi:ABC-type polysaccharide/polyol phosphate transport system ATPase subunit